MTVSTEDKPTYAESPDIVAQSPDTVQTEAEPVYTESNDIDHTEDKDFAVEVIDTSESIQAAAGYDLLSIAAKTNAEAKPDVLPVIPNEQNPLADDHVWMELLDEDPIFFTETDLPEDPNYHEFEIDFMNRILSTEEEVEKVDEETTVQKEESAEDSSDDDDDFVKETVPKRTYVRKDDRIELTYWDPSVEKCHEKNWLKKLWKKGKDGKKSPAYVLSCFKAFFIIRSLYQFHDADGFQLEEKGIKVSYPFALYHLKKAILHWGLPYKTKCEPAEDYFDNWDGLNRRSKKKYAAEAFRLALFAELIGFRVEHDSEDNGISLIYSEDDEKQMPSTIPGWMNTNIFSYKMYSFFTKDGLEQSSDLIGMSAKQLSKYFDIRDAEDMENGSKLQMKKLFQKFKVPVPEKFNFEEFCASVSNLF